MDNDGSYLSHGGFLGKLETMGATYRNNVDTDRSYLCQMKSWGLPKQIVNNGGYLFHNNADLDGGYLGQIKPWGLPKQIANNRGYLSKQYA